MAILFANPNGEMRGSLGATTYTRSASGKQVVRARVKPTNPQTIAQTQARAQFGSAATAYTQLASDVKMKWDAVAQSKGIKQGRWDYVKRYKWITTSNQTRATAGTGMLPATQPAIDTAILSAPNGVVPNILVRTVQGDDSPFIIAGLVFHVNTMALDFTPTLTTASKTMTSLKNAAGAFIGLVFEISVKKGQSKYLQTFVSVTKLDGFTAGASIALTGVKNSIARTNYKYNPLIGDTIKINCYAIDPGANYERVLLQETTVTAVA